jgi:hypothetical protein
MLSLRELFRRLNFAKLLLARPRRLLRSRSSDDVRPPDLLYRFSRCTARIRFAANSEAAHCDVRHQPGVFSCHHGVL